MQIKVYEEFFTADAMKMTLIDSRTTWSQSSCTHRTPVHNHTFLTMFVRVLFVLALLLVSALAGTTQEGLEWLANKEKEEGVIKRESGLLYKVVVSSESGHSPLIDSKTTCNYEGRLIDGTVFDSSFKRGRPATFAPNQVIKGWTEAMQLMKEGDTWELYLPSELAYGDRGAGGDIPPGAVLIFTLEMIEVLGGYSEGN